MRENPLRAAAVGHNIHGYKLTAFVIAAAYAGFAGGLLGVMQAFMPPDAFMFETSGQLVMQTAIGGRGTLFGPLVGASVWLFLQDVLQSTLNLGATWKLVLGLVFVIRRWATQRAFLVVRHRAAPEMICLAALGALALLRAISLHQVGALLSVEVFGVRISWIVELACLHALMLILLVRIFRTHAPSHAG